MDTSAEHSHEHAHAGSDPLGHHHYHARGHHADPERTAIDAVFAHLSTYARSRGLNERERIALSATVARAIDAAVKRASGT